jgi:hypothetical protein
MRKLWVISLVLVLALVMVVGVALPVSAAEPAFCPTLPGNPVQVTYQFPVPASYVTTLISGGSIIDGSYAGWCVDTDKGSTPGIPFSARVYCTYDTAIATLTAGIINTPAKLPAVNWLLNQGFVGQGSYDIMDVQEAVWLLLGEALPTPPPTADATTLYNLAKTHNNFVPDPGDLCYVILIPVDDVNQASLIRLPVPGGQGRWTGGGTIGTGATIPAGVRVTHGFEFHNDLDKPNNFEVNWGGNHFHMTELTYAKCWLTEPPNPPKAPVSEVDGIGTGKYNGEPGYTITFHLTDFGEPGTSDSATIKITKDADHSVVLQVSGFLIKGNQQAHPDNK